MSTVNISVTGAAVNAEALRAERATLLARLAEIDLVLEQGSAAGVEVAK